MVNQSTELKPPRYRWLKRLTIAAVAYALIIAGLRWYWGEAASAQLQLRVDAIKAKGEILFIEDFSRESDTEEDAADLYRQAALIWKGPDAGQLSLDPALVEDDAKYLADNREALALVRKATATEHCDWGTVYQSPGIMVLLPHLGESRSLARRLDDAAMRTQRLGQHTESIELIIDMLAIADHIDKPAYTLIEHLVAIAERSLAVERIEDMTPTLNLEDEASRKAAKRLIDQLLDQSVAEEGRRDSLVGERGLYYDTINEVIEGRLPLSSVTSGGAPNANFVGQTALFLARPLLEIDLADGLNYYGELIRLHDKAVEQGGCLQSDVPDFESTMPPWTPSLSELFVPALGSVYQSDVKSQARIRMAACALAIRLYEADHDKRPESLEQLVPKYLAAVPIDPFDPTGGPIRYRLYGVTPTTHPEQYWKPAEVAKVKKMSFAILYCVGIDGKDDGGILYIDKDHSFVDRVWDEYSFDEAFLLDAKPPIIEVEEDDWLNDWYEDEYKDGETEPSDDETDTEAGVDHVEPYDQ